jgi:EmrB/QacA subfamily drug resistance transporter
MSNEAHRSHYRVTFSVISAGIFAYALLQSFVTPVLPTIQKDLHTTQSTVTWVLTAYLLSASIVTPIVGRIGDRVGKAKMFVVTLIALALGSLLAALATSIGVLIFARAVQGIGGGVLPLAFGIVRDEFPHRKVGGAVGFLAALTAVGGGIGVVLAGPIVHLLSYHWLFWIPFIMVSAACVAARRFIPESPVRGSTPISWQPAVLLSAWLVCLLLGLSQAPTWGWGSGRTLALFAAAVVLCGVWIVTEERAVAPLIDMRMMRLPAVWTTNVVAFVTGVGMYSTFAFLPQFVQTPTSTGYGFGASITGSGVLLLPNCVTMFVVSIAAAPIARRIGAKAAVVIGSLTSALGFAMLVLAHDHEWQIYIVTGVLGIGIGLAFSAMSALIVSAVSPEQTGVASGMNANIRTIGGSVGAALMASIVTAGVAPGRFPPESGYVNGFTMLMVAFALAAVTGLLIPVGRRVREPHHEHPELALVAGGTVVDAEAD